MTAATAALVTSAIPGTAAAPGTIAKEYSFGAVLVGGNEVPGPGDSEGYGLANVRLTGREVCWRVTVSGVDPITMAHILAGPAGVAGPVVVPLDPVRAGCDTVALRLASFIKKHPEQFYVNVHNAAFPAGALLGQVLP